MTQAIINEVISHNYSLPMDVIWNALPQTYHPWVGALTLTLGLVVAALTIHSLIYFIAGRLTQQTDGIADTSLVTHTRHSARLVMVLLAVQLALPYLPLAERSLDFVYHLVTIGVISSVTYLVIRAMAVIDDVILNRYRIDVSDNLSARTVHTKIRIFSRTAMFIVAVVGASAILMTFPNARQIGASLLASAGIAGLVIGMAARPTFTNLIAGLQLALTQPIRLDDVVIIEGEWGRIEEITPTYVVVCIWDQRRLIVPLQYFIEHPFENWTRNTSDILGTVFIHADHTVPIQAVRDELKRIVEGSQLWDKRVCLLQVTNTTDRTIELRALVSAADASKAWDLRCLVREMLVVFLQRHCPDSLPQIRARTLDTPPRPLQTIPATSV